MAKYKLLFLILLSQIHLSFAQVENSQQLEDDLYYILDKAEEILPQRYNTLDSSLVVLNSNNEELAQPAKIPDTTAQVRKVFNQIFEQYSDQGLNPTETARGRLTYSRHEDSGEQEFSNLYVDRRGIADNRFQVALLQSVHWVDNSIPSRVISFKGQISIRQEVGQEISYSTDIRISEIKIGDLTINYDLLRYEMGIRNSRMEKIEELRNIVPFIVAYLVKDNPHLSPDVNNDNRNADPIATTVEESVTRVENE